MSSAGAKRVRLKNVADILVSNVDKKSVEGQVPVRLCNYTDVYYNENITSDLDFMEATASPSQVDAFALREGDVLITKDSERADDIGVPAFVPERVDGVVCGYHLAALRARRGQLDPRYLFWIMASTATRQELEVSATGVTRYGLRLNAIGDLEFDLLPYGAQRALAECLDRETAHIDGLIENKGRLRRLLVDRWEWEIELAVTRGLDPKRELQVCSSSLFDRLPEGWVALPLKRRWRVIDCKHRTPEYMPRGYPLATPGDVEDGRLVLGRTERYVGEADFRNLTEGGRRPKRGDIVYTRNASIGVAAYVDTDDPFSLGQDVCLITSDDQDQRFLAYFLNSVAVRQIEANKIGVSFDRINVSQILELEVPCPPQEEQRAVGEHLDARRAVVEELLSKLDTQVHRLSERRNALITAAVTGELDLARAS